MVGALVQHFRDACILSLFDSPVPRFGKQVDLFDGVFPDCIQEQKAAHSQHLGLCFALDDTTSTLLRSCAYLDNIL